MSLTNALRSWKKTVFYLFLLVILTALLSVGLSLSYSINKCIEKARETYKTTGIVEYINMNYPNTSYFDQDLVDVANRIDVEKISHLVGVKNVDRNELALGSSNSLGDSNNTSPYLDDQVLIVCPYGTSSKEENVYYSHVIETIYSFEPISSLIYLNSNGISLTIGNYYLVHTTSYVSKMSSYTHVLISSFISKKANLEGVDTSLNKMVLDITDESNSKGYSYDQDSYFCEIAKSCEITNTGLQVWATSNIEVLSPFQGEDIQLLSGRFFRDDEYGDTNQRGCIISKYLADINGLKVGDTIDLNIVKIGNTTFNESFWAGSENPFDYSDTFTIVGLFSNNLSYNNYVFIPQLEDINLSSNHGGYTLLEIYLENDITEEEIEKIKEALPFPNNPYSSLKFTIYDQGYKVAISPLRNIQTIASIVSLISVIAVLVFLIVYSFMYIYKERKNGKIMYQLGTKKQDIFTYYTFGTTFIALMGGIGGSIISYFLSVYLGKIIEAASSSFDLSLYRYSNFSLSTTNKLSLDVSVPWYLFLIMGCSITLLSFAISCIFTKLSMKEKMKQETHKMLKKEIKIGKFKGGSLNFSLLFISRSGFKAFIPIFVGIMSAILFVKLPLVRKDYETQLNNMKENTEIDGYFSSSNGKYVDGLIINAKNVNDLINSGYIDSFTLSFDEKYLLRGLRTKNNQDTGLDQFTAPKEFQAETLQLKIDSGPRIVFCNKISGLAQLMYVGELTTNFLDGYSENSLAQNYDEGLPNVVISTNMLESLNASLGDTIEVLVYSKSAFQVIDMRVIGSYVNNGNEDRIFCQIDYIFPYQDIIGKDADADYIKNYYFRSFTFQLNNASHLTELKNFLKEKNYSLLHKANGNRLYPLFNDRNYIQTYSSLEQKYEYMGKLFPIIYLLMLILSIVVPVILVQMRKKDIAIMKGLGTSNITSFNNIFIEYMVTAGFGVILGVLLSLLLFHSMIKISIILILVCFLLWILSTSFSLLFLLQKRVMGVLHDEG